MSLFPPVRALLFDLDDTLIETYESHRAAIKASCERAAECYPEWTPNRLEEAFRRTYRVLEAKIENGSLAYDSQQLFRTHTWEETLRHCGLDPVLGEHLGSVYLAERRSRYRLYEDVEPLLPDLARRYELVLVTNGLGGLQREKIEAVRLERWFARIVISAEVKSWKPDASIFHHALALAGVTADQAVMVGDSLERDIRGSSALGIRSIWMRRYAHLTPCEPFRPDAVAVDLHGVLRTLSDWDKA